MNTTPLAPSSAVCGKKMNCASPRHKRRHGDREQERAAAVFLLERRTDEQQKEHVAHIVAVARVTEDVREQAQIRQGIGERRAVDAEKPRGRRAARDIPEQERQQAQQRKAQHHGRVEADDKFFQGRFPLFKWSWVDYNGYILD